MSFDKSSDSGMQLLYAFPSASHQTSTPDPSTWARPLHNDLPGQPLFESVISSGSPTYDFDTSAWGLDYAWPLSPEPERRFPTLGLRSNSFNSHMAQATSDAANTVPLLLDSRRQSYSQPSARIAKARTSFLLRQSQHAKRTHASKPALIHKDRCQSVSLGELSYQRWDEFLMQGRQGHEIESPASLSSPERGQWKKPNSWAGDIQWGSDGGFKRKDTGSRATDAASQLELARYKELVVCNAFKVDEAESSIEIRIPSDILMSQREDFVQYERPKSVEQHDVPLRQSRYSVDSYDWSIAPRSELQGVEPIVRRARPPRKAMPEEKRRQNHIRSEQRRRSRVEELYIDLRSLVPTLSKARYTKSTTLFLTADWVKELSQGNETLRKQVARLRETKAH